MESVMIILPFVGAGLFSAVFSRLTGMNLSMCMIFIFLYMGAIPEQAVAALLMFNAFTYFTTYSQKYPVQFQTFTFFKGAKFLIPIVITFALALVNPFFGIVFFVIVFLAEIFAKMYQALPVKVRPSRNQIIRMAVIASILAVVGVRVVHVIPTQYYFAVVGIVVVGIVLLMWFAGDRRRFSKSWDAILYGTAFLTGLTGMEIADWLQAMKRTEITVLSRMYSMVINIAIIVALVASYGFYSYFSLAALFATIGASLGIRFFGMYTYSEKGAFSYITMGITFVVALVFMIIQPQPSGFVDLPTVTTAHSIWSILHF